MAKFLSELGLPMEVDRWDACMDDLKDLPGFSPHASSVINKVGFNPIWGGWVGG